MGPKCVQGTGKLLNLSLALLPRQGAVPSQTAFDLLNRSGCLLGGRSLAEPPDGRLRDRHREAVVETSSPLPAKAFQRSLQRVLHPGRRGPRLF